jgi:FkbM family methyltransferase
VRLLKRLTYRPELIAVASWLGLRGILRNWYYRWSRPPDGILQIQAAGITAEFCVHTPEELRMLGKAESGHWEQDVLEFLVHKLSDGGVVYDIGSNIGLYAIFLAKAVGDKGQVIAFEPEAQSHRRLQENLELNALKNVRTFQVALGDYKGEAKLYFSDGDLLFANLIRPRHKNITYQVVKVLEGDRLRETENLPCPRVVKIDVEGFEYAVMRGLRATLSDPSCEIVSCEVHPTLLPPKVKERQLLQLLRSLGFGRIDIHRWGGIAEYHVLACKS